MSQTYPSPARPRGPGLLTGMLVMLIGALVLAIGFGFIPTDTSKINAPPWLLAVFGGTFLLAGLWAVFQRTANQGTDRASWINFLFALLLMLALAVICLWIGFGSGQRLFVQEIGSSLHPTRVPVDPTLGRIFFGTFGILISGVTAAFVITQGRKLFRRGNRLS